MRRLIWIVVMLAWTTVHAQVRFTATVDRTVLRVGESVQLTLTFEGAASGIAAPALPQMDGLKQIGGPFSSSNTSIINGRVSSSSGFTYVLRAVREGRAEIGAAQIAHKGQTYRTQPISLTVLSPSANAPNADPSDGAGEDVFLRVYPDKKEVYLGEQVSVQYKIFFTVQITNPEFVRMPKATGFWIEDIPLPKELPLTDEIIGGKRYRAAVIRKSALFATTVGDLEVEPLVVNVKIQTGGRGRSRDPFDLFNDPLFQFGRQMVPREVASPDFTIRVKPLPQVGVPAGFDGAVGQFRAKAVLDRPSCHVDEGVTLTVDIEGQGNIQMLPKPQISFPADIQSFDPEITDDIRRGGNRVSGRKSFRYVLIPRAPGVQVIPAWSYVYFDPERGQYSQAEVPELRLAVDNRIGGPGLQPSVPVASKQGVETIATDIAFAKTRAGAWHSISSVRPHASAMFWIGTGLPWAGLAAIALWTRVQRKKRGPLLARLRAERDATRLLDLAERQAKTGKIEVALRHLDGAAERAIFAAAGMTAKTHGAEQIREAALANGIQEDVLTGVQAIREECDLFRFGAGGGTAERCQAMIQDSRARIEALLKTFRANGRSA
ncbi:MAG: BatD family protein [bacterium]|nr:BatD family protein [bacterium]